MIGIGYGQWRFSHVGVFFPLSMNGLASVVSRLSRLLVVDSLWSGSLKFLGHVLVCKKNVDLFLGGKSFIKKCVCMVEHRHCSHTVQSSTVGSTYLSQGISQ